MIGVSKRDTGSLHYSVYESVCIYIYVYESYRDYKSPKQTQFNHLIISLTAWCRRLKGARKGVLLDQQQFEHHPQQLSHWLANTPAALTGSMLQC